MSNDEALDSEFDWLANIYTGHGAFNHPSELHGILFGELSGGSRKEPEEWLQMVLDHMGVERFDEERQPNIRAHLQEFYDRHDEAVEQDSSSFVLLLPDDEYALTERLEALSVWVRGFLEGIALSASAQLNQCGQDIQEILRDFVEISQMDARVPESEEAEREFFEVCEYVRVGVLNVYAEFNAPPAPENEEGDEQTESKPTLH